ncbi:DEP domain-containing protein 1A-like isoform X2 [Limulus polyphemus]|uniref:DEP domain-containing protein 1A-like isoform X2 n=1 Tax=Limulus polyphemus TaxID=6850 RepID=A0ABM1SIP7_LIMPO|nr:DEP domain-containing protein 1A-like isoform X2 [Limulus polyphemus]
MEPERHGNESKPSLATNSAPYRATKLWNQIISDFRCGMPLKRHRHYMRIYENCFTASEAVDWLLVYLRHSPNFGPGVTRQQTIQLLQKFLKTCVIEDVRGSKVSQKDDFQDNGKLYHFVYHSPSRKHSYRLFHRTPLSTRNCNEQHEKETFKMATYIPNFWHSPQRENYENFSIVSNMAKKQKSASCEQEKDKNQLPECCFVARSLSMQEIERVWATLTLERLQDLIPEHDLDDFLNVQEISGRVIMHNMCRISRNGVVVLTDKTDDLPYWVMSAMKCLANWPHASGSSSCLPNYPGFELDVFRVVRDYFNNLGVPLIPFTLYDIFVVIFKESEFLHEQKQESAIVPLGGGNFQPGGLSSFSSIENLLHHLTLNQLESNYGNEQKTSTPITQTNTLNMVGYQNASQVVYKNADNAKPCGNFAGSGQPENNLSSQVYFETAFSTATPVTRVVSHKALTQQYGSQSSIHTMGSQSTNHPDTQSTISACSYIPESISSGPKREWSSPIWQTKPFLTHSAFELNKFDNEQIGPSREPILSELQGTSRCHSADDLDHFPQEGEKKKSYGFACGLVTLPRQPSLRTGEASYIRGFGSMRHLKREYGQRKNQELNKRELSYSRMDKPLCGSVGYHSPNPTPPNDETNDNFSNAHSSCCSYCTARSYTLEEISLKNSDICQPTQEVLSYSSWTDKHINNSVDRFTTGGSTFSSSSSKSNIDSQIIQDSGYLRRNKDGWMQRCKFESSNEKAFNEEFNLPVNDSACSVPSSCNSRNLKEGIERQDKNREFGTLVLQNNRNSSLADTNKKSYEMIIQPHWCQSSIRKINPIDVSGINVQNCKRLNAKASEMENHGVCRNSQDQEIEPFGNKKCYQSLRFPHRPDAPGSSVTSINFSVVSPSAVQELTNTYQLLTLLFPSSSRRHLHLLLRMINKVVRNDKLKLHPDLSTRSLMLKTFVRSILCSEKEADYDELLALHLVAFLMDNCENIFQPSSDLREAVENRLTVIKYTVEDPSSLTYCEQVSVQQFEEQKVSVLKQALTSLLEKIVNDSTLSEKEKKKKLKQFKENHPDVYATKFPNEERKVRKKAPLLKRIMSMRV